MDHNSDNNVFRFNVLRPVVAMVPGAPTTERSVTRSSRGASNGGESGRSPKKGQPATRSEVLAALREIERLDLTPDMLRLDRTGSAVLNRTGQRALSARTSAILAAHGVSLGTTSIQDMIRSLTVVVDGFNWPGSGTVPAPAPDQSPQPARLKAVGISDLMVVKQQIKRYEPGEIAYIENVMAGETRARLTRTLDRVEEVVSSSRESERETENEVQATDRYELNRELTCPPKGVPAEG